MSTAFTVARNTVYLSLSTSLALCIALGFNVFLARTLGVERFGEYSFAISFIALFSVLVEFSLDSVIIRDVARDPTTAGKYFSNTLALKGLLFLLTITLVSMTASILDYPSEVRLLLYILSLGLLLDGVTKCCVSLFSAAQRMQCPAALFIAERLLFALFGLVAVSLQGSVIAIVVCYVAAQAVTQLAGIVLVRQELRLKAEAVQYAFCKRLAQRASPFFAISMVAAVYADIDKVFLFSMQDEIAVGLYAAAYKLVTIPTRFSNAFHQALYPVLSQQANLSDRRLLTETYRRSMRYLILGSVPLAVGTTALAKPIICEIYGQSYVGGTVALQILIWAYALEFFNPFFGRVLFATGQQQIALAAVSASAGLNIALNIILIPRFGFVAAAVATLLSAGVIFVLFFYRMLCMFPNVSLGTLVFKPAFAGLVMWIVCHLLGGLPLIPLAILGAFVYCGCLVLTKAFSAEELLTFRRVLVLHTETLRRRREI